MTIDPDSRSGSTCTPWAELGDLKCQEYGTPTEVYEQVIQFASDVLYDLSGRRWPGMCEQTVRPAGDALPPPSRWPGGQSGPISLDRGLWGCVCNRSVSTGCGSVPEFRLADRVASILEVKVDGVVVDPSEYQLMDHRYLVGLRRPDGSERTWPCCQILNLPDSEIGTWSVRYARGGMPPVGGTLAAASLACELAKGMGLLGDEAQRKCRLPRRVTSIVRQQVTVAVLDPLTLFQEGRTGLAEVDLWLSSLAMGAKRRRGTIVPMSRRGRGQRRPPQG